MKQLLVIAFLAAACSGGATATAEPNRTSAPLDAEDYARIYGGLTGAYRSILDETNCVTLQEEMYTATENKTVGFQAAISDRAAAIGCPDLKFNRP
jgi:hypothetical protein